MWPWIVASSVALPTAALRPRRSRSPQGPQQQPSNRCARSALCPAAAPEIRNIQARARPSRELGSLWRRQDLHVPSQGREILRRNAHHSRGCGLQSGACEDFPGIRLSSAAGGNRVHLGNRFQDGRHRRRERIGQEHAGANDRAAYTANERGDPVQGRSDPPHKGARICWATDVRFRWSFRIRTIP
jgi:hypothetical protein